MLGARIYTEHNCYLWALGNRGRIFCFKHSIHSEVLDLCDQRRQLKQQKYTSTEAGLEYRKVNRDVRKKMKAANEEWTGEQRKNVEKGMMSGKSKEALRPFIPRLRFFFLSFFLSFFPSFFLFFYYLTKY